MASKKDKAPKGQRKTKDAPKNKKRKAMGTSKFKTPAETMSESGNANNQRTSGERVAIMREKLKKSLEDPEMRDQIVRAIRTMMNEDR